MSASSTNNYRLSDEPRVEGVVSRYYVGTQTVAEYSMP